MLDRILVTGYPIFLLGLFLCTAVLAAAAPRPRLSKRSAFIALLIILACSAARWTLTARTHQVYFDEFEHMDIARNLARSGSFAESLAGGAPELDILAVPTWPGGFHVALGLAFKAFGASETVAYAANALIAAAGLWLVFLLGAKLFDERAGLAAVFLLAALPLHARYAAATDLTMFSLFCLTAVLLCLATEAPAALLAATLACAVHARFENVLLIPAAYLYLKRRPGLLESSWLLFMLAPLAALALRNRAAGLPGFAEGLGATLGHLARNLPANILYGFTTPTFLFIAAAAAYGATTVPRRTAALFLGIAAAYAAAYSCFFRGAFAFGSEDRYALALVLPLVLLAGRGLAAVPGSSLAGAALFLALALPSYGKVSSARYEAEYRFIQASAPLIPEDALVISYSPPAVIMTASRAAASPYLLLSGELPVGERPLILFKDHWWHERAQDSAALARRLSGYAEEPLARVVIDGREHGFFRLVLARPRD